jgi:hypothetical protein
LRELGVKVFWRRKRGRTRYLLALRLPSGLALAWSGNLIARSSPLALAPWLHS